jgi:hypothetical protein
MNFHNSEHQASYFRVRQIDNLEYRLSLNESILVEKEVWLGSLRKSIIAYLCSKSDTTQSSRETSTIIHALMAVEGSALDEGLLMEQVVWYLDQRSGPITGGG